MNVIFKAQLHQHEVFGEVDGGDAEEMAFEGAVGLGEALCDRFKNHLLKFDRGDQYFTK